MGRGATKREGGGCEVLPLRLEKGGAEKVLAMLKGGHKTFWGSFYAVLAILKGGAKGFHSLKGGGAQKVLPCLEGGSKKFQTHNFSIL